MQSRTQFRHHRGYMGGTLRPAEFSWKSTDDDAVRSAKNPLGLIGTRPERPHTRTPER